MRLALKGLPAGTYAVEVQRVGCDKRAAYSACLRLGSPAELTPARARTLRAATQPAPVVLLAQRRANRCGPYPYAGPARQ